MKIAAVAALMFVSGNINAQNEYGPEKGDFGTEIKFNPFSNDFTTFKIDGLQFRYFISNEHALRLNLNVGLDNKKKGAANLVRPDQSDSKYKTASGDFDAAAYGADLDQYNHDKDNFTKVNNTQFGIDLGYEYHFAKFGRADLYAGAQVGIEFDSWKQNGETNVRTSTPDVKTGLASWATSKSETKGAADTNNDGKLDSFSTFAFGAGVFTGIDFYITKSLYVGAELGINFATTKSKNFDETTTSWNGTAMVTSTTKHENKLNATTLKFEAVPALRLGWTF